MNQDQRSQDVISSSEVLNPAINADETSRAMFLASLSSSPTVSVGSMAESPEGILQSPPILHLVAKLNPIMAMVKSQSGGRVSIWRNSMDSDGENSFLVDEISSVHADSSPNGSPDSPLRRPHHRDMLTNPNSSSSLPVRTRRRQRDESILFGTIPI